MKTYRRLGGKVALILNIVIGKKLMASFKISSLHPRGESSQYKLNRSLVGTKPVWTWW
jgi:hypothetical protein